MVISSQAVVARSVLVKTRVVTETVGLAGWLEDCQQDDRGEMHTGIDVHLSESSCSYELGSAWSEALALSEVCRSVVIEAPSPKEGGGQYQKTFGDGAPDHSVGQVHGS